MGKKIVWTASDAGGVLFAIVAAMFANAVGMPWWQIILVAFLVWLGTIFAAPPSEEI